MTLFRVMQTVQTTMSKVFYVDNVATDADGAVTVVVKRLDGTEISGSPFSTSHDDVGTYSFALLAQANVDALTLDWTATVAGAPVVLRDYVEIVGGFFFGLNEAYTELRLDPNRYPLETLAAKRILVEQECEAIRRQSQVPRFARFIVDGSGNEELIVPDMELRTLRAAKVADGPAGPFTALSAGAVAAVAAEPSGLLIMDGDTWPEGRRNVIVEYEYGLDYPPSYLRDAALRRLQYVLTSSRGAVPDRAITWTSNEGGTYRLTQAGPSATGIPDVDAAYQRDANERVWIA